MFSNQKLRRVIAALMASWLLGAYLLAGLAFARPAFAQEVAPSSPATAITKVSTAYCRGLNTAVTPDTCEGLNESAKQVDSQFLSPSMRVALLGALMDLITFVFDRLAYEAAIWVATGGEGETPLFSAKDADSAWKDFGLDIAGDAIGNLSDTLMTQLNLDFDICAPTNPLFNLSIQLGIKQAYQPAQPRCDFQEIRDNWDSFITSTAQTASNPSQTVLKAFAEGFKPGQNELSATVGLNLSLHQRVLEAKTNKLFEQVNSGGFKSVTDVITGQVKTPSSVLQSQFQNTLKNYTDEPTQLHAQVAIQNADLLGTLFLQVAGVFTNTLLSTLMNKIYTGLFDVQPEVDLLSGELASVSGVDDAADRFASLITASPTQVENYNVIAEFVTCPVGPIAVRNINNCVMDSGFASAVSRAESGDPMTVQEAVDEGLIHGDWPLIPHEGDGIAKNQDSLCYTYGYCVGNLVKMRKARVVPIGWEIAASRNDAANPTTLQDIIDGYNDCGEQNGGIDTSTHQWCHLIDPNWVIKYPETQCRALVNGELLISTLSAGRAGECADTPSCISEGNDGSCDGGFGYCVEEKNAWRFRGTECPEQYASCMAFKNTDSGSNADLLLNTVDYANCDQDNAGCEWYRTTKYYDDGGTTDDTTDDAYAWLAGDDTFATADREDDILLYGSTETAYSYTTTGGTPESYEGYAFEDRVYYNNNVEECAAAAAGCSAVYPVNDSLVLNLIQNPSFEDDEDADGSPDGWAEGGGTLDTTGGNAYYGTNAYRTTSTGLATQLNIPVAAGSFYAFSLYARQGVSTGTDALAARVVLTDKDGDYLDLAGTSVSSGCAVSDFSGTDNSVLMTVTPDGTDYERFECTFSIPTSDNGAMAHVFLYTRDNWVDSVQLELGETASPYTEGYNTTTPSTSYLLLAPDYLNCTGAATDPAECDNYVQQCTAQDVGCNLYTPDDGDPSVPAIAQSLDECPSECVGYASYKQEATDREEDNFPLYFIPERATACSSEYVGCDAFTNLDSVEQGGETDEYYTDIRACIKTSMAGTDADNTASTFFTWEGSDLAGYQLVTWELLESNLSDSTSFTYTDSGNTDDAEGLAPCTSWDVSSESELVCVETSTTVADVAADDTCDEHDDILTNPDCREFYDEEGNIHYRDVTATVAVSDDCHPYRYAGGLEADCDASGGFWTDVGDCRYYVLPADSAECPAAQAGCRSYTGGAGRNASTVYSDDFEDGDLSEYEDGGGAVSYVSSESVATGGHSVRVTTTGSAGTFRTAFAYLNSSDATVIYDADDATTCTGYGWTVSSNGNCDLGSCEVEDGDNGCGTLDDQLVEGKTYLLSFWAKGSGDIKVFVTDADGSGDDHDLVTPATPAVLDAITLEGGWNSYDLGPLDTTDFAAFGDDALLTFYTTTGETFYLDNVRLKAVEENVAIIKDSWVVPSTCDQTPDGADSPQYYLGCEEYTDQNGDTADLYQFSNLCSEEVVGCEAVFDTQNSDSATAMIYNARCTYVSNNPGDDDTAVTNSPCVVSGETVCTITAGESYCLFDQTGAVPIEMPYGQETTDVDGDGVVGDGKFYMELGPEARVVEADMPQYVVDNGTASCTAENAGCIEVGVPTYDQDKSNVTGFASAYLIDDPDDYSDILCENQALFCEEWSSTQDGNYYFKDPGDQTCEYQSGVTINGSSYSGWFRSDTSEPCYWTDTDASGTFDPSEDESYLVSGSMFGIWRNGDDTYGGWGAVCPNSQDLCTEFRDESDTDQGSYPAGTPYYFLDDASLAEESLTASEQCQGQVSQKAGCGLFNDTSDSSLPYNTTASFAASTHADDLFGDEPGSKQDPISCLDGGSAITTPDGASVNLCTSRCAYTLDASDTFTRPSAEEASDGVTWYDNSCYDDTDCPTLETDDGEEVAGTCASGLTSYPLENDGNRIMKVNRDRECAAWLSCQSSLVSWNSRTSKFETICDKVGLCTRYTRTGDTSFCTEWSETDPVVLDASEYAGRDTTWNGIEYAGYAIPNQLPVDQYDQVNIAPEDGGYICVEGTDTDSDGVADTMNSPIIPELGSGGDFHACEDPSDSGSDCTDATHVCRQPTEDFRLGYVAGSCSLATDGWLGECVVGQCEDSGDGCSSDGDCDGTEECVVGYCQYIDPAVTDPCTEATEATVCTHSTYPVCDVGISRCVNELAPNTSTCVDTTDCAAYSGAQCTPAATSKTGACINSACVTDISGEPFTQPTNEEEMSCRGYPEVLAPFPNEVVTEWKTPDGDAQSTPGDYDAQPYTFVYGFETVNACSPVTDESVTGGGASATGDCDCSYDKVQYGESGAVTRYYPLGSDLSAYGAATGVCIGGALAGTFCTDDDQCSTSGSYAGGTCATLSRQDQVYGWDGYCLERDTSIQKNGSSTEQNRACLTWLPVDQLSGSTDLYGKYVGAGFNQGDTYYCTEQDAAYYFESSDEFAAGAYDDDCDNDPAVSPCIDGSFEVVWGCEEVDGAHVYNAVCVPDHSFETVDGVINYSQPCVDNTGSDNIDRIDDDDDEAEGYKSCRTPTATSISELSRYVDPAEYYLNANVAEDTGSWNDDIHLVATAVCSQVVKVADSSAYNTGWTDRLFDHGTGADYTIDTDNSDMAYAVGSLQPVFGKADDVSESSPINTLTSDESNKPLNVVVCEEGTAGNDAKQFPDAGPDCDGMTGFGLSAGGLEGEDARAYTMFTWYASGDVYQDNQIMEGTGTDTTACTVDSDCPGQDICEDTGMCQRISCTDGETDFEINGCNVGVECGADYTCNLGPRAGRACVNDNDCRVLLCSSVSGPAGDGYTASANFCRFAYPVIVANDTVEDAANLINQIFAKSLALTSGNPAWWRYTMDTSFPASSVSTSTNYGGYEQESDSDTDWTEWDLTATGDANGGYDAEGNYDATGGTPTAPIVKSIGECDGTNCQEGDDGKFSVNGVDGGDINGSDGYKHISVSFFTYANANQMPIKNIIVDWGDGDHADTSHDWPVGGIYGSQSGSTSTDNFYQNHRGYTSTGEPICATSDSAATHWSESPDACDESYVTFTNDYVCTAGDLDDLPECKTTTDPGPDGQTYLTNSPCRGTGSIGSSDACVFQPRLSVKDNWGWCTGYCDAYDGVASTSYGTTTSATAGMCYGDECDTSHCPSGGADGYCPDGDPDAVGEISNPWIYYDGYVVVTP